MEITLAYVLDRHVAERDRRSFPVLFASQEDLAPTLHRV